jgi:hypothetical protein
LCYTWELQFKAVWVEEEAIKGKPPRPTKRLYAQINSATSNPASQQVSLVHIYCLGKSYVA